jgi:ubiquinone/menaquinone biosynthesis C-methylase UbiE
MESDIVNSLWEAEETVAYYASHTELQPPEATILHLLKPRLKDFRMLDIGVGAGRTTRHFAGSVREYVGIDVAQSMVARCRETFGAGPSHISFDVCDVKDLSRFGPSSFELVLFSFNTLDNLDHSERMEALAGIRRVCSDNGLFCFSTHNTRAIRPLYKRKPRLHVRPWETARSISDWFRLCAANPGYKALCRDCDSIRHTTVIDGAHDFRLRMYYVQPEYQLQQLEECHFGNVQAYALSTGAKLDRHELSGTRDSWLYYLCNAV